MKVIRWIVFIPLGMALMWIAQWAVGALVGTTQWWFSAPFILLFGALVAFAGAAGPWVAPNRQLAAAVLATLFVGFELLSLSVLLQHWQEAGIYQIVIRLYTDFTLLIGLAAISRAGSQARAYPPVLRAA